MWRYYGTLSALSSFALFSISASSSHSTSTLPSRLFDMQHFRKQLSWLYTYRFSHFVMFVHYFVRLRTNHYTLLTISPISFIFDSARNLSYHPLWCFVKIPIVWRERRNARWEKWLAGRFMKCHLYTSRFSHFANIFSYSPQFDDKCIAGFWRNVKEDVTTHATYSYIAIHLSKCCIVLLIFPA